MENKKNMVSGSKAEQNTAFVNKHNIMEDLVYQKMLIDVNCINYTHEQEGVSFTITKTDNSENPFTISISCGEMTYSRSIATYPEFQVIVNAGLGYFLGIVDDIEDAFAVQEQNNGR